MARLAGASCGAVAFTSIGKKVIATTTAAFDCQSKPNHITMIGAMPTMGMALARPPSGRMPRRRSGEPSIAIAASRPALQPIAQPGNTERNTVWRKSAASVCRW